jgi:hypothetical protein
MVNLDNRGINRIDPGFSCLLATAKIRNCQVTRRHANNELVPGCNENKGFYTGAGNRSVDRLLGGMVPGAIPLEEISY